MLISTEKYQKLLTIPQKNRTNEQHSSIEVYEFAQGSARKIGFKPYVAYLQKTQDKGTRIVTFTGEPLASVTWRGCTFKDNFGCERFNFRALGIDGHYYYGTYYGGNNDFIRMRRMRGKKHH